MAFKHERKAAQGIGTLIIFIALVLVAAVAAGVLIQTTSSLQSKSLDVGRQSQEKITSDIEVVQVFTTDTSDGSIDGGTDNITIVVRLGSGSNTIKLSDLLLKFDSADGTQTLIQGNTSSSTVTETTYGINYVISGTNHKDDYLVEGDLAEFTFTVQTGLVINESDSTTLRLIAKNGAVKPVDVSTPAAMVETTTYLYP